MANIMSKLKLTNRTSRNGFDISRKNAFTAKVGELLPVCCIECLPGDNIKGKIQHFTRTQPVNTAAYTRMREYYDWFFVPTNLMWNKFNTFITQMTDNNQHATSINGSTTLTDTHPYFTVSQIARYLDTMRQDSTNGANIFNYSRAQLSAKLLNYLGYGDYQRAATQGDQGFYKNVNLNPFPLLAYQKIYQDYFRNSQWEKAFAPAFNLDYITGNGDLNIPVNLITVNRNVENMFDMRYCNWNKDLFMGLQPNSQYGDAATINIDLSGNVNLGLGNTTDTEPFYMYSNSPSGNELITAETINLPSNANSRVSIGNSSYGFILNSSGVNTLRSAMGLSISSSNVNLQNAFTILALRQAEALQKWKEITQSQQQDYKNQIEAHFGVSMSDAYSERCRYIDGSVSNLDISEVTNTNLTGDNDANLAGKGVGVGSGGMNFKTDVHGYLMCIYHCVPLLDYAKTGINRMNTKTNVVDYAIPEFDKTGMVQVPLVELSNTSLSYILASGLLGYAPRYYDYKTAIDEVHGAFVHGGLDSWVAPVSDSYIQSYLAALHGVGISDPLTYVFFKVNPAILNPIFGVNVNSSVSTDQLLINASFDLTAVRNLDRNGLPY